MTDDTESLTLRILQEMRQELTETRTEMRAGHNKLHEELGRINLRLSVMEDGIADILAVGASDRTKMDRLEKRIDRIERRLEMVD